jgi:TatD DNase family protein
MLDRAAPDDPRLAGMKRAPLAEQAEVCEAQLELAARLGRPASVHCLEAFGPLLELLQKTRLPARGFLLHAYSGPAEMVPAFAELGAYFSFNGAFLEARKRKVREAFLAVPPERLLVETDAPAMMLPGDRIEFTLPPSPAGEHQNHPGNLRVAYAGLAELRGMSLEALTTRCAHNYSCLFSERSSCE